MKINAMESIVKLWFEGGRIHILTDRGNTCIRQLGREMASI